MMKTITWIRYKLKSDNRMFWDNFHSFGITYKSSKFIYYKYFLKSIGMLISLMLGFFFAFILSRTLHWSSDIGWILYFSLFYIVSPWFEGKQASSIQSQEMSLVQSILKVQGVRLDFVKQLYYAQYSFRLSIISDILTVIGFSIVYNQPALNLAIFLILGEFMRFAVMALSNVCSSTVSLYSKTNSSLLKNAILMAIIIVFVISLITLRITFFENVDLSRIISNPYSTLNTLLSNVKNIDFTNLSYYNWFPGTMAVQASLHLNEISLLFFLCVPVAIYLLTYMLASLNQSHRKSSFYSDLIPILSDTTIIRILADRGGILYAEEKEAFLNPAYKRNKLLLVSFLFVTSVSMILFSTSSELIRFSLFFIFIMWVSITDKDVFTYNTPFTFSLNENLLLHNISVGSILMTKVGAAVIFQYVYIIFILVSSLVFFSEYQLRIVAIVWGLILICGKTFIRIFGSLYTWQQQPVIDIPTKETKSANNKLGQMIASPLSFVLLVLLYQPTIIQVQNWFYPFGVYTLLSYVMASIMLASSLNCIFRKRKLLLLCSLTTIGIVSGIPAVAVLTYCFKQDILILALIIWIRLIWLCGSYIQHNLTLYRKYGHK